MTLLPALAAVLVCAFAQTQNNPEYWASSFTFIGNTDWFNPNNWVNRQLPKTGAVITFPDSFNNFGREHCKSTDTSDTCRFGGNTFIRPQNGSATVDVEMGRLYAPLNGKLVLVDGARMVFTNINTSLQAEWAPRSTSSFDFRCAQNWGVNGTGLNPGFIIPCYLDSVLFPNGETFMVNTPAHTYIHAPLGLPTDNPFITDSYQYSGFPLNYVPSTCPLPFSANTDVSNCLKICFNTCPEQNPDRLAGWQQMKAQNQSLVNFLGTAINQAVAAQSSLDTPVVITGSVSFPIPNTATAAAIQNVFNKTNNQFSRNFAFPLNSTCSLSASAITCGMAMTVTQAQLPAYTSSAFPPYTFNNGLLLTIFGSVVQEWFALEVANSNSAAALQTASSPFFTVTLSIPKRFFDQLGTPFPTSAFATALAASLSVSSVTVLNVLC